MDSTETTPPSELTEETAATEPVGETPSEKDWQAEYASLHDQYLRLAADFENFRKRVATEREALLKYGAQNTIEMLLPVLDNLELGASSLSAESSPQMLYQSFAMLSQQLLQALQDAGLKKESPLGQEFDPARHDATGQEPAAPGQADNIIIRVQKSGYQLHDRVLRPAQVVVSQAEETSTASSTATEFDSPANNPFSTASSAD